MPVSQAFLAPLPVHQPAPPAWSPLDLPNIELWLNADAPESLSVSGVGVVAWNDLSPAGHILIQPTAVDQPTIYGLNGNATINSRQAINWSDPQMSLFSAFIVVPPPFTISFALQFNGTGASQRYLFDSYNSQVRSRGRYSLANADKLEFITAGINDGFGGPENISATGLATGLSAHVLVFHHAGVSGTSTVHKNGVLIASGQLGSESLDGLTLGNWRDYVVGLSPTGLSPSGRIGEVIIASGVAVNADREKTEGYLAHHWGLANLLPAGHPHKEAYP